MSTAVSLAEHPPELTSFVDVDEVVAKGEVRADLKISSAGQPSEAALEVFAANGYAAVIDLRGSTENRGLDEQAIVEALGMEYLSLPITGSAAVNFENARVLDQLIEKVDGPVLIHCGSGNRVGAILALRESLSGASDEDAVAVGTSAGLTRLEPLVRKVLQER